MRRKHICQRTNNVQDRGKRNTQKQGEIEPDIPELLLGEKLGHLWALKVEAKCWQDLVPGSALEPASVPGLEPAEVPSQVVQHPCAPRPCLVRITNNTSYKESRNYEI